MTKSPVVFNRFRSRVKNETREMRFHTVGRNYFPPYSPRPTASSMSEANGMARERAHGVSRERSERNGLSERALTAKW
jgi:hypothetical protein